MEWLGNVNGDIVLVWIGLVDWYGDYGVLDGVVIGE